MTAGDTVVVLPSTVSWLRYVLMHKTTTGPNLISVSFLPHYPFSSTTHR